MRGRTRGAIAAGVALAGGLAMVVSSPGAGAAQRDAASASDYNGPIQGTEYDCIAPRDPGSPIEGWAANGADTGVRFNGTRWSGGEPCGPGELRISRFPAVRINDTTMYMQRGSGGATDQDSEAIRHGHVRVGELSRRPASVAPAAPNGRPCAGETETYYDNPQPMPEDFEYKPGEKYSDWENYGDPLQTDGSNPIPGAHYNYVLWSWLTDSAGASNPGGGQPRAIIGKNEVVHRCAVDSITSPAYAEGSDNVVGYVRGIYARVATNAGDDVYGWVVHSWRRADSADWTFLLSSGPVA